MRRIVLDFEYEIELGKAHRLEDLLKILALPANATSIRITTIDKNNESFLYNMSGRFAMVTIVKMFKKNIVKGIISYKGKNDK